MAMRKVAVIGAGMTKFMRRAQETPKELAWQATHQALQSCEMTMDDIEAVCLGTAPDSFDGIHMNGEYLIDGAGGWQKPYMRSYVGGGTGVFVPIQGWYHVASGLFDVVLVVAEEKMSSYHPHAQAAFLTIFDHTTERPLKPNGYRPRIGAAQTQRCRSPCCPARRSRYHSGRCTQLRGAGLACAALRCQSGLGRCRNPHPGC